MITLKQFINEKYAGSISACARANGVTRQAVQGWLNAKSTTYVINGQRVQVKGAIK